MQAGGHNPFVNRIGMQVDNIVELEVVTADGKFQKVSECNNPELFWALRGGGGSTQVDPSFKFSANHLDSESSLEARSRSTRHSRLW
jgi:hypothetical protein